jgi:hypothetical protein
MARQRQTRNISEEERQRRSEAAKRLVAEGKIGGYQPKKVRVTAEENPPVRGEHDLIRAIVEETNMDDVQELVIAALIETLQSARSPGEKLRAAQMLMDNAHRERKHQIEERRALDNAERTAIMGRVLQRLDAGPDSGEEILDADFTEHDDERAGHDPDRVRSLGTGEGSPDS